MSLLCAIGGHEAESEEVYNGGYWFSRCRRCQTDMIRAGGCWTTVPPGHRVVWRSRGGATSVAGDDADSATNMPAVRPLFESWSREMVGPKAAPPPPEAELPHYPRLLVLAAIIGAGLQLTVRPSARRQGLS